LDALSSHQTFLASDTGCGYQYGAIKLRISFLSGSLGACTRRVTPPRYVCAPASGAGLFCRRVAVRQGR